MPGPVKTVTLQVNALTKEANAQLLGIRRNTQALIDQNPIELKVKLEAAGARAELAVLRREIRSTIPGTAGGGGRIAGLLGRLGGGGAAGAVSGLGVAGIGIGAGALGALAIAAVQAGAALTAAAAGMAAFGALAIPTLTKLAASSPGIRDLHIVFRSLVAALRPDVVHLFNQAVKILVGLLPQLLPFADATAKAFGVLLKGFAQFASSNAFGLFLNQLSKLTGPAILALGKGLGTIAVAVGKLIIAAAQPESIRTLGRVLGFVAVIINGFSWAITTASRNMQKWIDIAHQTASKFDEFRHDTARVFAAVATIFDQSRHAVAIWGHDVLAIFNALSRAAGSAWNILWHTLVTDTVNGIRSITGWFGRLPAQILGALRGLGHTLGSFASAALNEMWAGFRNVGGRILSWLSGFWHSIIGLAKKILGVFSPSSVFYDIGKNLMLGLEGGIKSHAHTAVNAARVAASRVANVGSGVQRWAPLVRQALAMEGLSPGLLHNVLYQMQTESGGNPNAINLTDINFQMGDPSRGLMQVIGSTFAAYHWPGTSENIYNPLANIAAALNYARHVYGPTLMSGGLGIGSGHGYAAGSWKVPYTGSALIHQGEMIIPARAAAAIRAGAGGEQRVVLEFRGGAEGRLTGVLLEVLRKEIRTRGGNVQLVLGRA